MIERSIQILKEEGIQAFFYKSSNYALYIIIQKLSPILSPLVKWLLTREGRSWEDASWLIKNRNDRHDALIGPNNALGNLYVARESRARHIYRYLFAANLVADTHGSSKIRILDVAAGTGYGNDVITTKLSQDVSYISTEFDSDAVRYSAEYYPRSEHIQGDVQELPYSPDTFDVIISYETIEHVPNPGQALTEFKRVLKNDGELFISAPYDEDLNKPSQREEKKYPHRHSFDEDRLLELLSEDFSDYSMTCYQQRDPETVKSINSISRLPPGISRFESVKNDEIRTILTHIHQ